MINILMENQNLKTRFSWKKELAFISFCFVLLPIIISLVVFEDFEFGVIIILSLISYYYLFVLQFSAKEFEIQENEIRINYLVNFFLSNKCYKISNISKLEINGNAYNYGSPFLRIYFKQGTRKKYSMQSLQSFDVLIDVIENKGIPISKR